MIEWFRKRALLIVIVSLLVNVFILVSAIVLWVLAIYFGWVDSIEFVSHISMLALVFSGVSGVAAAVAAIIALVPTDDLIAVDDG